MIDLFCIYNRIYVTHSKQICRTIYKQSCLE